MTEDQRTAGHPSHAGPPSAATAAGQVLSRLTELARTSLKTQASMAKQSVDLTWASVVADLDRANANKAYVASVTRESARYWRTVGELSLDYASDLATLSKSVSTTVLREVAAAGRKAGARRANGGASAFGTPKPHAGVPKSGRRAETVSLPGSVGDRAEMTITVANQHPRPRRIQLRATDIVDSAGTAVGAVLDISPASVTVASEKQRPVRIGVDLGEASFSAGERYSCAIEVIGDDEATVEVSIEVSAQLEAVSAEPGVSRAQRQPSPTSAEPNVVAWPHNSARKGHSSKTVKTGP